MNIIPIAPYLAQKDIISIDSLKSDRDRRLASGLIAPAVEVVEDELAAEHSAEPIKDMADITRIAEHLLSLGRYRDYMLFIVGINFGLRVSDLRSLRFTHLISDNCVFRERFPIFEKKTRNTRKKKKNRYITINNAVIDAVTCYLEHTPGVCLSDYLFRSESNRGGNQNLPLTGRSIDRILKSIASECGLSMRVSTHTLRKTFCYHQMLMSHNDPRKLLLLQKMLNHSSAAQTLDYIGITAEEFDEAYRNLNLGSTYQNYMVNAGIEEYDSAVC